MTHDYAQYYIYLVSIKKNGLYINLYLYIPMNTVYFQNNKRARNIRFFKLVFKIILNDNSHIY